jgi:hypothetical protein
MGSILRPNATEKLTFKQFPQCSPFNTLFAVKTDNPMAAKPATEHVLMGFRFDQDF